MEKRVKTDLSMENRCPEKKFPLNRPEVVHGGKK